MSRMGRKVNCASEGIQDTSVNVGSPQFHQLFIQVFGVAILQLRDALYAEIEQILCDAFADARDGKQVAVG